MNPYRAIQDHPCDFHIEAKEIPRANKLAYIDDYGKYNIIRTNTIYFPRCINCNNYVDVEGTVIGKIKMRKEMQARHEWGLTERASKLDSSYNGCYDGFNAER